MNIQSQIFSKYLGDVDVSQLFSDEVLIKKLVLFEIALAQVQSTLGIIPQRASEEISSLLGTIKIDPTALADGTLQNGIPVVPALAIIKSRLPTDSAKYLHYGATSQDAMDTACVLILKDAISSVKSKLERLTSNLEMLSERYGDTACMARTRGQLAAPTLFKHKVHAWLDPLVRQEQRLQQVVHGVLTIQLGGAVGDLSAYNDKGNDLKNALASALDLRAGQSWHTQRDNLCEFTNWLTITSGILGKMGSDILVMSQSEIGELMENREGGGKSSVMAHKSNPILSEALVALAKMNAGLQSIQLMSLVHANERDATSWILEWQCIPQIVINAAASLNHALTISEKINVNTERMKKNVEEFKKDNRD